jgi:hypothetical protein
MAKKILAVKFERTDKKQIHGKVGHSRTGACTAKGRCFHGRATRGGRPNTAG